MRGYPTIVLQKQDYLNLLSMQEHKAQALSDLQKLYAANDDMILTTTTQKDPDDPMSDWNTEMLPNPSPLWKQKGFESREDLAQNIPTDGGRN